ncbi:hypothetical protein [Parapedobacter lycopersici]|uniref:hypothetical protein n=1 Tax=Parapedobacter lycopersici TaxID=1864939 RepID=UPI00214D332A|nr:hypothetical protein [Parapedobacter lycopersici]
MTVPNYQSGPSDEQELRFVHGSFSGIHRLKGLLNEELTELELEFSPTQFMAFYNDFRERETAGDPTSGDPSEPAFYWIKGRNCWIRVCFQPHESYYSWGCYTTEDQVTGLKMYFANKKNS